MKYGSINIKYLVLKVDIQYTNDHSHHIFVEHLTSSVSITF